MASRPKFWPWPQTFGLGLASISLSYYAIGHFSGKYGVKIGNFVNFSGNYLKSYDTIRIRSYDTIAEFNVDSIKLSIQLNLAHVARN